MASLPVSHSCAMVVFTLVTRSDIQDRNMSIKENSGLVAHMKSPFLPQDVDSLLHDTHNQKFQMCESV